LIDEWDQNDKSDSKIELFKNLIDDLTRYLLPTSHGATSSTFVLTFLSGTAPYAVIKQKKASKVSFEFVECPLLDEASIIRIVDHFAAKFKAPTFYNNEYKWKLCAPLLQLLLDTGGLPRALEQLFMQCFWSNDLFFQELNDQDFNDIFDRVKIELDKKYNIKQYVLNNSKLATKILYHCIEGIPVNSMKELEKIKIRDLERDGRIVLSKCDKDVNLFLMYMPFFFICLYNDALKIVDVTITDNIFRVSNRMFWQQWELFVLYHEAFRTNLSIKMGTSETTVGKLYPGACMDETYSEIYVKLKELSVCEANEQFPVDKSLTNKHDNKPIDLESGEVVILNSASAEFAGIILVRMNSTKYLFMIQCKWDYCSIDITEKNVEYEDVKNLKNLIYKVKEMYDDYELITVVFTTQPYTESKKSGIIVISKENFNEHFGPAFSSRATFFFTRTINPNFWEKNRLKNTLDGIGDASIDHVFEKRPYINEDHYYQENQGAKKQKLDFFPLDVPGTNTYAS
jgi:hypothetical protein